MDATSNANVTMLFIALAAVIAAQNTTSNGTANGALESYLNTILSPTNSTVKDGILEGGGQPWLEGSMWFLGPLAFVTLICRLSWRRYIKQIGADDRTAAAAGLALLALTICDALAIHYGNGKHIRDVVLNDPAFTGPLHDPSNLRKVLQLLIGMYVSYTGAISFGKYSIVAAFRRIYWQDPKRTRILALLSWVCIALGVSTTIAVFFLTTPVQSLWDPTIPRRHVLNIPAFFKTVGALNFLLDTIICSYGFYWAWGVRWSSERGKILFLYSIGYFACAASGIRLFRLEGLETNDITYTSVMAVSWSYIEASVMIIVTSIPPLKRPLWFIGGWIRQFVLVKVMHRPTEDTNTAIQPTAEPNGVSHSPTARRHPSSISKESLSPTADDLSHDLDPADDGNAVEMHGGLPVSDQVTNHDVGSENSLAQHENASNFV